MSAPLGGSAENAIDFSSGFYAYGTLVIRPAHAKALRSKGFARRQGRAFYLALRRSVGRS
jgi:cation transport regulator ChaC